MYFRFSAAAFLVVPSTLFAASLTLEYAVDRPSSALTANAHQAGTVSIVGGNFTLDLYRRSSPIGGTVTLLGSANYTLGPTSATQDASRAVSLGLGSSASFQMTGHDDQPAYGLFDDGLNDNGRFDMQNLSQLFAPAAEGKELASWQTSQSQSRTIGSGTVTVNSTLKIQNTLASIQINQDGSASISGGVDASTPDSFSDNNHPNYTGLVKNLTERASADLALDVTGDSNWTATFTPQVTLSGFPFVLSPNAGSSNAFSNLAEDDVGFDVDGTMNVLSVHKAGAAGQIGRDDSRIEIDSTSFASDSPIFALNDTYSFSINQASTFGLTREYRYIITGNITIQFNGSTTLDPQAFALRSTTLPNSVSFVPLVVPEVGTFAFCAIALVCVAAWKVHRRVILDLP